MNVSEAAKSKRLFKFYSPKNQRSKVSLVAHRREVTGTAIHNYIPEFIEEFYDKQQDGSDDRDRNYVVKAYVFSEYLDENVSLERGGFEFQKESDLIHGVSQADIEKEAAEISRTAIDDEITARQEKKKERVQSYVDDEAPWHRDLLAYDRRVLFGGDNESSNPVTIFEFKKPQRDDFTNPSSTDDPIQQIVRYVNQVREGKFKTPKGREILVTKNTPFYGFVVCDLTAKVEGWLELEKDYKPMPDRLGWFKWHDNINLYLEVISWDKVLRDAEMRNQIFFHKLGIN